MDMVRLLARRYGSLDEALQERNPGNQPATPRTRITFRSIRATHSDMDNYETIHILSENNVLLKRKIKDDVR